MNKIVKKNTGSFYTCQSVADYVAKWAIRGKHNKVLEPSFGDGSFVLAANKRFKQLKNNSPCLYGVEIQKKPYNDMNKRKLLAKSFCQDFISFATEEKFDAVIGNPPYIRLRRLKAKQREKTLKLMHSYNFKINPNSSLWLPFIIHSTELLDQGGRLGMVLPYEITYVRYAFDLWSYLGANFNNIKLIRVYKDFFPDVDVETIILLADGKGGKSDNVEYNIYNQLSDLFLEKPFKKTKVKIADILGMKKPFEKQLLSSSLLKTLSKRIQDKTLIPITNICKFKIGYIDGNKEYFHPNEEEIKKYKLRKKNLLPSMINTKSISSQKSNGLSTSRYKTSDTLFYPTIIKKGEKAYIELGEKDKVNEGYKCRQRKPWYLTPGLETPDVILTVFSETPKLLLNDGKYIVSNSLLSGKIKGIANKEFICRWYNSLTLLLTEINVHSLGGGTLVIIPGEIDCLNIVSKIPKNKIEKVFTQINELSKTSNLEDVYKLGDEIVLKDIFKYTDKEIRQIRKGIETLRKWRQPKERRG